MERLQADSSAPWAVLRPPRLRDAGPSGGLVRSPTPIRGGRSITTGDLALALLEAVDGRASPCVLQYVATR